jgi:hypothetical protein
MRGLALCFLGGQIREIDPVERASPRYFLDFVKSDSENPMLKRIYAELALRRCPASKHERTELIHAFSCQNRMLMYRRTCPSPLFSPPLERLEQIVRKRSERQATNAMPVAIRVSTRENDYLEARLTLDWGNRHVEGQLTTWTGLPSCPFNCGCLIQE